MFHRYLCKMSQDQIGKYFRRIRFCFVMMMLCYEVLAAGNFKSVQMSEIYFLNIFLVIGLRGYFDDLEKLSVDFQYRIALRQWPCLVTIRHAITDHPYAGTSYPYDFFCLKNFFVRSKVWSGPVRMSRMILSQFSRVIKWMSIARFASFEWTFVAMVRQ